MVGNTASDNLLALVLELGLLKVLVDFQVQFLQSNKLFEELLVHVVVAHALLQMLLELLDFQLLGY